MQITFPDAELNKDIIVTLRLGESNVEPLVLFTGFRYYYLYGGTTYDLNPNVKFRPSGLLRVQEEAPFSMDITARFILYEAVSVGTSYRWADAIMLIVEVNLHENLHFGYAYDHTLSDIGRFSNGSHEIMLNYRYKVPIVHQGLACPAYF